MTVEVFVVREQMPVLPPALIDVYALPDVLFPAGNNCDPVNACVAHEE